MTTLWLPFMLWFCGDRVWGEGGVCALSGQELAKPNRNRTPKYVRSSQMGWGLGYMIHAYVVLRALCEMGGVCVRAVNFTYLLTLVGALTCRTRFKTAIAAARPPWTFPFAIAVAESPGRPLQLPCHGKSRRGRPARGAVSR